MESIKDIHIIGLKGLGASYRFSGFCKVVDKDNSEYRITLKGVAFGGFYGGHNVNVQLTKKGRTILSGGMGLTDVQIDEFLTEVQRKILQGDMKVHFGGIKPEQTEAFPP